MRLSLAASFLVMASPALAFDPGTHGEPTEESGYFVACAAGEGGNACEIHARGAIWMAYSDGPSEADAVAALEGLAQGAPVSFTGDMISMGDITVDFALNTVDANPDDPLAPLVADLQGTWMANGAEVTITGLEWAEADGRAYLMSIGIACADGQEREGIHVSLYEMGGDPFTSICLRVDSHSATGVALVNVGDGTALTLAR